MGNQVCLLFCDRPDLVVDSKDFDLRVNVDVEEVSQIKVEIENKAKKLMTLFAKLKLEHDAKISRNIAPAGKKFVDTMSTLDGTAYRGLVDIDSGEKSGWGIFTYGKGKQHFYQGQWEYDKTSGIGLFQDGDGEYKGMWSAGGKNGFGIERWVIDGTVFKGQYKHGKKQGLGLYQWGDGSEYIGQFYENEIDGVGRLTDDVGVYTGEFSKNSQHGEGSWKYENGDTYKGQFKESKRHGKGRLHWISENKEYIGQWYDDVPHGKGMVKMDGGPEKPAFYLESKLVTEAAFKKGYKQRSTD